MTYRPEASAAFEPNRAVVLGTPEAWSGQLSAVAAVAAAPLPRRMGGCPERPVPAMLAQERPAMADTRAGEWAGWIVAGVALLLCWSVSYLLRQPGLDPATPFSPLGSFALEGVLLSLVWIAAIAALALALAAGRIVVRHDRS